MKAVRAGYDWKEKPRSYVDEAMRIITETLVFHKCKFARDLPEEAKIRLYTQLKALKLEDEPKNIFALFYRVTKEVIRSLKDKNLHNQFRNLTGHIWNGIECPSCGKHTKRCTWRCKCCGEAL